MLTQQQIAFEKNKTRIGSTLTCLVDSISNGNTARGRFLGQAPEIDPICIIHNCHASTGAFIQAKVTGSKNYDLLCEQI
jgi:tRNA A37 methylthiotransferase MiaB